MSTDCRVACSNDMFPVELMLYAFQALTAMADANDGKVICPRTKDVFDFTEAEKVFVM